MRLLKRVRDEECSRFGSSLAGGPLAKRYQLLGLLGKGGFSEVFKVLVHGGGDEENRVTLWERNYYCLPPVPLLQAYDLLELRFVACKIHQLTLYYSPSPPCSITAGI